MSYCRTFKPSEEAALKLKKDKSYEDDLNLQKNIIVCQCMSEYSIDDVYTLNTRLTYLLNTVKLFVRNIVENQVYSDYESSDDKTFSFCGWRYSHEYGDIEEDTLFNDTLSKLLLMAIVVKTPNYFTSIDTFYDKCNDITEAINVFIDNYSTIVSFDIIDKFKEFDITNKEEDETDTE